MECKINNDKIMDAICDAILRVKDVGGAGEIGGYSNSSNTSNNADSISDFKFNNEPLVYRTNTMMDCERIFNEESDVVDLFIKSNPMNNIFTNNNMLRKNIYKSKITTTSSETLVFSKLINNRNMSAEEFKSYIMSDTNRPKNSAIFRSKSRSSASKLKNNTKLSAAEFKSFILNDSTMFNRQSSSIKNSSRVLEQFKSYQLNELTAKKSEIITANSMENTLADVEEMPQCNVPNFIQENLSVFSNTISDTYSLLKVLERNNEKMSNKSFDEEVENVINYTNFITDDF